MTDTHHCALGLVSDTGKEESPLISLKKSNATPVKPLEGTVQHMPLSLLSPLQRKQRMLIHLCVFRNLQ